MKRLLPVLFVLGILACSPAEKSISRAPEPPSPPPSRPSITRVVLDPGHGGESVGAIGVNRLEEKAVTLEITKRLAELILSKLRVEVLLTRGSDKTLPLEDRTRIANDAQGTLFVSIHTNASETRKRHGVEVYYLDNTDDEASMKLAARENGRPASAADQDLSFIVSDVIQNAKMDESITLAHYTYEALLRRLQKSYSRVKGNGVMKAPFSVLVGAHMPAVLVEVSYIDEKEEGKRLGSKAYQDAIAEGIFLGLRRYLSRVPGVQK